MHHFPPCGGDGRALHHFMEFWASVCKSKGDFEGSLALPLHNKDIIEDPKGLKLIFLQKLWDLLPQTIESKDQIRDVPSVMARHTFVLSRDHVEKLKKWVSIKCKSHSPAIIPHITTFVVTCSLIWVCKVISEDTKVNDESYILAFIADCRNRPEFSIPSEYFGNCLVCGNVVVKRSNLVGGNGILEAAIAIGKRVRQLQGEAFEGTETLISNLGDFATLRNHITTIAGSSKLEAYETDGESLRGVKLFMTIQGQSSFLIAGQRRSN